MRKKLADSPASPSSALFGAGQLVGFLIFVALAVGLFVIATQAYRRRVDAFQISLDRYAAERALTALEAGDLEAAKREVALLETETPIGIKGGIFTRQFSNIIEGPVFRNRVTIYEKLTTALFDADLLAEAETVAWKMMLEFHIVSRTVELIVPWNLMTHLKLARGDWTGAFESLKVLAAHGPGPDLPKSNLEKPSEIGPVAYPVRESSFHGNDKLVAPSLAPTLKDFYKAMTPPEYLGVASRLEAAQQQTSEPTLKRRIREMRYRSLVAGGDRTAARAMLAELWGRDPATMDPFWRDYPRPMPQINLLDRDPRLMEYYWLDRPSTSTMKLTDYVDSYRGDGRLEINDLTGLVAFQTGYFQPENKFIQQFGETVMYQSVGARLEFSLNDPVRRIYLAYQSTVALGIYPIVLLRIDDRPYIPLYCDSTTPGLLPIDVTIEPGSHRIDLIYLNDSGFVWPPTEFKEDRNITLYRMVFVHLPPGD